MIRLYGATCAVLIEVTAQGATFDQQGDALSAIKILMFYEFVFILYLVKEIMAITDLFCRALHKSLMIF